MLEEKGNARNINIDIIYLFILRTFNTACGGNSSKLFGVSKETQVPLADQANFVGVFY